MVNMKYLLTYLWRNGACSTPLKKRKTIYRECT